MIRRNCQNCGRFHWVWPYIIKNGNGQYCSAECRIESTRKEKIRTHCSNCNKIMNVYPYRFDNNDNIFCSYECMGAFNSKTIIKRCIICDSDFETLQSIIDKGKGKYCSRKCFNIAHRKDRVNLTCKKCGGTFKRLKSQIKRDNGGGTYCSKECQNSQLYPNTIDLRTKIRRKRQRKEAIENLYDRYVKAVIVKDTSLSSDDIPQGLIETKRQHIKIKRLIKDKQS